MRLGLKLLHERAVVGSLWWPYIANLPEAYSLPIFFSGEDIKNLQYAPLLYQINKRCRFLLDFEKEVQGILENVKPGDRPFGGQNVDASSLGWAMSAASSRAFHLQGSSVPMMLPLIDMCNHSFNPNARVVLERHAGNSNILVKVVAETQIEQSDPLLINYGCLSNDLFLLDYGFVATANPYDCIELVYDSALLDAASMAAGFSSPCFSSPSPWQQAMLSRLNLGDDAPNLKISIGGEEVVDGRLLAALRILLAGDVQAVEKHDSRTLGSLSAEAPVGIATEIAVLRTLTALGVICLRHFPTTIAEDESLLKRSENEATRLAIQFRIEKKALIVRVLNDFARRIGSLQWKEDDAAQR